MDMKANDISNLEKENRKLKEENEILKKTVEQMNCTLNRLLNRYVTGKTDY